MPRSRLIQTRIALLAIASALTACAVGPDYSTPTMPLFDQQATGFRQVGATVSETIPADDAGIARFWTRFNDAGLNQLIAAALASNYELRIAAANWNAARVIRRSQCAANLSMHSELMKIR